MQTNRPWTARRWMRAFRGARRDSSEDSASGRGFLFGDERPVRGGVHQARDLGGIGELNFDEPCGAVWVGVDGFRSILERTVCLDDFSGHRGVNFADRFDGFDCAKDFPSRDFSAHRRQFDKDDVAELMLRVVCNSDRTGVAGHFDPLMFLGVPIVAWIHHSSLKILPGHALALCPIGSASVFDHESIPQKPRSGDGMVWSRRRPAGLLLFSETPTPPANCRRYLSALPRRSDTISNLFAVNSKNPIGPSCLINVYF